MLHPLIIQSSNTPPFERVEIGSTKIMERQGHPAQDERKFPNPNGTLQALQAETAAE
jgi:hypothetical protein